MRIIGGYSQNIPGYHPYTVYRFLYKDVVYALEVGSEVVYRDGKWVSSLIDGYPILGGKYSTISHETMPITEQQLIDGIWKRGKSDMEDPSQFRGLSYTYIQDKELIKELESEFIKEFKDIKSYERESKINIVLD
jgi:hypothetical protein